MRDTERAYRIGLAVGALQTATNTMRDTMGVLATMNESDVPDDLWKQAEDAMEAVGALTGKLRKLNRNA